MLLIQQNLQANGQSLILTAEVGSFSVSGQDAQIKVGLALTAQQSSFTLDGQAVGLSLAYRMVANIGEFALSGQAAQITAHRLIAGELGQFVVNGQDSQINANRTASVQYGQFAYIGQDVVISKDGAVGFTILAEFGEVTLSGQPVQITKTAKPTTTGAIKRPQPVFTPKDYKGQIKREDEILLMLINETIRQIKI